MTLAELDYLDMEEADRLRRDIRTAAIMHAPEAERQQLVAFALLLRFDISPETALLYLRQASPLHTAPEVTAWIEAIPVQPAPETLH